MRILSTILIAVFCSSFITAQQTKRSFVGKTEMKWLNDEVASFESTLARITKANKNQDINLVASNRTKTINGVNRFSKNTSVIIESIQTFIDKDQKDATKHYIADEPRDVTFRQASGMNAFQQIVLFDGDLVTLHANSAEMLRLQSEIEASNFEYLNNERSASSNIDKTTQLFKLAKECNAIIQKSKVQ